MNELEELKKLYRDSSNNRLVTLYVIEALNICKEKAASAEKTAAIKVPGSIITDVGRILMDKGFSVEIKNYNEIVLSGWDSNAVR